MKDIAGFEGLYSGSVEGATNLEWVTSKQNKKHAIFKKSNH